MEISPHRLRVFLAVADTLHFGRAAQRLRISQPSVSQQVSRLERDLGCVLFHRRPGRVELTAAGRDLVKSAGPALRGLDEAVSKFRVRHHGPRRLRVGLLSSLTDRLAPLLVASWKADVAGVELAEGSLSLLAQRLHGGELDVVFCYSPADPTSLDGLQVDVLDTRPVLVALRDDDELAAHAQLPWAALAARTWVMPSASRQYREDMIDRFRVRGLAVSVVAEATTLSGQLALVEAGIGLTFASPWSRVGPGLTTRPTDAPADELVLVAVRRPGTAAIPDGMLETLRLQVAEARADSQS
ncbi:LysR family transcriptional regulator [Lapillicoccus jejuensis]|uniref:LysR family transcriptional regulator n=1 Tax=Lapillicoccus jejuensis TaxID=402171 RepID=UPI001476DD39|nr:LysR family transcriptional regulator [Lapillicoccus jejuensis]